MTYVDGFVASTCFCEALFIIAKTQYTNNIDVNATFLCRAFIPRYPDVWIAYSCLAGSDCICVRLMGGAEYEL